MSKSPGKTSKSPKSSADHAAKQPVPESPTANFVTAFKNMEEQRRATDGFCDYNLSAMYRACGQPPDKDPLSWVKRSAPMILAVHKQHTENSNDYWQLDPIRVLLLGGEDIAEFAATGDCETLHDELALMYAHYLGS